MPVAYGKQAQADGLCLLLDVLGRQRGVFDGRVDTLQLVATQPAVGLGSRGISAVLTHIPA